MVRVNMAIKILLILASAPFQIFIIHIIVSRYLCQNPPQLMAVGCVLLGQIPIGVMLWFFVFMRYPISFIEAVVSGLYAFIAYNTLAYTYFHLFNMSETARRIKILYEIDRAGVQSKEAIPRNYGITEMLSVRLKRLVDIGQLEFKGDRYTLKGKILYLAAWIVMMWGKLLGFQTSNFDVNKSNITKENLICSKKYNENPYGKQHVKK